MKGLKIVHNSSGALFHQPLNSSAVQTIPLKKRQEGKKITTASVKERTSKKGVCFNMSHRNKQTYGVYIDNDYSPMTKYNHMMISEAIMDTWNMLETKGSYSHQF